MVFKTVVKIVMLFVVIIFTSSFIDIKMFNNVSKEQRRPSMKINDFAVEVTKLEVGKKEVNIAQIKEILKVTNELLDGELYKLIRKN